MLTVYTACTGDAYSPEEVQILQRQVKKHLHIPHQFVCITEHEVKGTHTQKPINDLPGWWVKTTLFSPRVSRERNLWLDLDVVVTKSIDDLIAPLGGSQLRIAKNWAVSGHGGCQSSVMYWEGDSAQIIHDEFDPKIAHWPPVNQPGALWGDQEWITVLRDTQRLNVSYFPADDVVSYKYHCRQNLPDKARVVVFHGKPDPADVNDQWVREARQCTL